MLVAIPEPTELLPQPMSWNFTLSTWSRVHLKVPVCFLQIHLPTAESQGLILSIVSTSRSIRFFFVYVCFNVGCMYIYS